MHDSARPEIILASSSRYRRELLARLGIAFDCLAAEIDETAKAGEAPRELASRLARSKAEAVARLRPTAIIIGSDQVADIEGRCIGKPGTRDAAIAQLRAASGRSIAFHTALCVLVANSDAQCAIDTTTVRFRTLDVAEIERYVDVENPLDCAGSFKAEGLGISLFDAIESIDPTALIGLPLIALARMLRALGAVLP